MNIFNFIQQIDFSILNFLQDTIRCDFLDIVMLFFSKIGSAGIIWILTGIVLMFFKKHRATGVILLSAMAFGYLVGEIGLKNIICRPRPFTLNPSINLPINPPDGFSFPSGHSCSSFACATVLMFFNKKFGIPALAVASLIAFSRLYNYVHFPSDVLAGICLGIISAIVVIFIFRKTGLENRLSPKPQ